MKVVANVPRFSLAFNGIHGLVGEIDHLTSVVQQKMIELDHIDAAIRIFKPDIDLEKVKAKTVPPRH